MIEVAITRAMLDKAADKANKMGTLKNSILNGDGNFTGFLGEEVAREYFKKLCPELAAGVVESNTYDYDLVLPNGLTVDVKTKRTTVTPKPHYDCSVAGYNTTQNCDLYAFVRVHAGNKKAWFLGCKSKAAYYAQAIFYPEGYTDRSNNMSFKSDTYNLPIAQLDLEPDVS